MRDRMLSKPLAARAWVAVLAVGLAGLLAGMALLAGRGRVSSPKIAPPGSSSRAQRGIRAGEPSGGTGESPRRGASLRVLRVCADPNNLPFSDRRGAGFENKIAELVARDLGSRLAYTWWPQRRGFVRKTLKAGLCDVVMGIPASFEPVLATRPYYRSSYVFLWQRDHGPPVASFDDPVLRRLRVGVPLVADDYANAPPAMALAHRGLAANVVGYSVYGDYSRPSPPAAVVEAVAKGEVDVAVVWGPLAGYFAPRQAVPLAMAPVSPQIDLPFLPFVFDISMGVRRGDTALRDRLDQVIERRRAEIDAILDRYGVPRPGIVPPGARLADAAG